MDFAGFVTDHGWLSAVIECQTDRNLHDMVAGHASEAFPSGDMVPLQLIF